MLLLPALVLLALAEQGLNAQLYYRNKDFRECVSLIPTSAITGEGVPDILMLLVQLSQKMLVDRIMWCPDVQCTVLEVKVIDGLGCTVDVILVNGEMENGCTICVCTTDGPVVTQVRALLTPPPNRELRIKSQYVHNDKIKAAIGIKICAPGLENAVAGSPVMVLPPGYDQAMLDDVKDEVMADFKTLAGALATDKEGVLACASTLGALEALLVFLREECEQRGHADAPIHMRHLHAADQACRWEGRGISTYREGQSHLTGGGTSTCSAGSARTSLRTRSSRSSRSTITNEPPIGR